MTNDGDDGLTAVALVATPVAVFGIAAYSRRRADLDLLVFGLLNVAIVLVDGGLAAAYAGLGEPARGLAASDAGRALGWKGSGLLFHTTRSFSGPYFSLSCVMVVSTLLQ